VTSEISENKGPSHTLDSEKHKNVSNSFSRLPWHIWPEGLQINQEYRTLDDMFGDGQRVLIRIEKGE
jgi:hypothetical protein